MARRRGNRARHSAADNGGREVKAAAAGDPPAADVGWAADAAAAGGVAVGVDAGDPGNAPVAGMGAILMVRLALKRESS